MAPRHQLLQQAEQEYDGLKAAIDGLDEPRMREVWLGHWGVREILAHITGWHHEMLPALARLGRGEAPYPDGTYDDFDRWNARFVKARKDAVNRRHRARAGRLAPRAAGRRRAAPRGALRRGPAGRRAGGRHQRRALPRARRADLPLAAGLIR